MGTKKRSQSATRKPRADAQRNRDRLLEVVKGVQPVRCGCQLGRHCQTCRCRSGGFVSPLSYARWTSKGGLPRWGRKAGLSGAEVCGDDAPI